MEYYIQENLSDLDVHYVDKKTRHNIQASFNEFIKQIIMPALSLRDSKEFSGTSCKQKLAGLLQRTLRSRITSLLNNHSINFDPVWIGEFVKKRNHAAHGNYSYESKDYMILARMISLLDIVIMKELGYKGEYIDWSKSPPEEIILS